MSPASFPIAWILTVLTVGAAPEPPAVGSDLSADSDASSRAMPVYATRDNRLLVGLYLRGREVGTITAIRNGGFLLPLDELAELAGIDVTEDAGVLVLHTPIGDVTLDADDVYLVDGIRYLTESAIGEKLASPVRFDPAEFAIDIDLAWTARTRGTPGPQAIQLVPEIRPPALSLSTLRLDARYLDTDLQGESASLSSLFAGRADGGRWQLRLATDLRGTTRWQDYAWLRAGSGHLLLVGHQRVQLHPVMPGLEVSGVQLAFTNQSLSLFSRTFEPGALLPRRLRPVSSFTGSGPPAGVAELRVEGSIIARRTIGINGLWDFYEVPVPSFQYTRIEVWLYERHNTLVPVEVLDQSRAMSSFLLPAGAWVHQGGGGYWGNIVQDIREDRERGEAAGFYQWRQGLTPGLTIEAATQIRPDRKLAMAGLVARPWRELVLSAALAANDGSAGSYHVELDWRRPQWYLRGLSRLEQQGFVSEPAPETHDHYAELGHSPHPTLDLALIARSLQRSSDEAEFVLPAVAWRPSSSLYVQARPDELGDYIFNLWYRLRDRARLSVYHQNRTFIDLSFWPSRRTSLFAGAELGGTLDNSYSLLFQVTGGGRFRPTVLAGPLYSDGALGYEIKTSVAVAPGILLRVEYGDDPLRVPVERRGRRFLVALNTALTWAHGKVMSARTRGVREDRGGIAGVVRVEPETTGPRHTLEGLAILVAGRPVARTSHGGRFYAANLREGVYEVELDTENLPIELQPARSSVVVQIAGGAITRVEFTVRPEFGIAGRLTDLSGRHLPGIRLLVENASGETVARATTDRFGLYGRPPATYTLRLDPVAMPGLDLPTRKFVITDDFLFGQDLILPALGEGAS